MSETVGEAYIRILADGSGLDRDIRKEWKKHEPEFDEAGRRNNDAYRRGFDDNYKKRPLWAESVRSMRQGRGQFEAVGKYLGDGAAKELRKTMEKELGDKHLARRIFKNLSEEAQRTGDLGVFKKGLGKNMAAEIARATQQIQQANEATLQNDKKTQEARKRLAASTEKEFERLIIRRSQVLERQGIKDSDIDRDRLRRQIDRSLKDLRRGDNESSALLRRSLSNFNDHAERGLVKATGFFHRTLREMTPLEQKANGLNKKFDHFASLVGKASGAGSRNNFFNALGKSVEGVTRLMVGGIPRIVGTIGELGSEFRLAGRRTDEFGNKISFGRRVLNLLDTALQNTDQFLSFLSKGILGAVGGFGAMFVIAAPLAAALSSLAAGAVALTAAVAFGLVGAIGALLPILGAAAAGAVVLGFAFAGLNKAQKTLLQHSLAPVIKDFRELRSEARKALFSDLPRQVPLLSKAVRQLTPIFKGVGRALALSFTGFLKVLNSPAFEKNFDSMQKFFPEAITKLGKVFTNVFSGMSSILRALVPFANKLLDSLVKSTQHFAIFANSAKGQNRIKNFMDRAWESATKLWHTVRDLFRVIGDLMSAGRGPGNGLLDSINSSLERFDRFLRSDKGKRALAGWFADMKTFFSHLGDLLAGIGKLFNALDSPQGHKIINALLTGLGKLLTIVAQMIPPFLKLAQTVLPPVIDAFKALFSLVRPLFDYLSQHKTTAKVVALSIIALSLALKGLLLVAKVNLLLTPLFAAFGRTAAGGLIAGWGRKMSAGIGAAATGIQGKVRILGSALAGLTIAMGGSQIGHSVGGTAGKGIGIASWALGGAVAGSAFGPVGTAIGTVIGTIGGIAKAWHDSGQAAKAARDVALQAMLDQKQAALSLAEAIRSASGDNMQPVKDNITKGLTGSLAQFDPKKKSKEAASAVDIGSKASIDLNLLQQAALGVPGAFDLVTKGLLKAATAGKITGDQSYLTAAAIQEMAFQAEEGELAFEKQAQLTGDLAFAMIPLRKETAKYGKELGTHTAAARRNEFVIRTQAAALTKAAFAHASTSASAVLATATLFQNAAAFRKNAIAAGFDKDAVDKLTSTYFKIPHKVSTLLEKAGVTPAQIQGIIDKYHGIPPKLLTELLKKGVRPEDIQAIIDRYYKIPPTRSTVITVRDQASGTLRYIQSYIDKITGTHYTTIIGTRGGPGTTSALAAGDILTSARMIRPGVIAGEAGREAVVPLDRPLSLINPSVRAIAAFAQGLENKNHTKLAGGGVVGGNGKVVQIMPGAISVVSPSTDPVAVAAEWLNHMAARGYA